MGCFHGRVMASFLALAAVAGCVDALESPGELSGRIVDGYTGLPVADARVEVEGTGEHAFSGAGGELAMPAPAGTHRVTVTAPGFLTQTRVRVEIAPGDTTAFDVALHPRSPAPELVEAVLHAMHAEREALRDDPDDPALRPEVAAFLRGELGEGELLAAPELGGDGIGAARAALTGPPTEIRVWRRSIDGASSSCRGRIDRIPFEDYVAGVLPHEWIPSWHDESLRAGALAIRTYSWNWINRGGKYDCADLDDTTRSQVYRDDRTARATAAVEATRGQGIVRGGSLVSGEYSAEHGGTTADGVTDSVCAGRARSGHGRGMCQWGSQRWATSGRDHAWIAEHYWPGSSVDGGRPPEPCGVIGPDGGVVEESGPCFSAFGDPRWWRRVDGAGSGGSYLWTNAFRSDSPSNWARWSLELAEAGRFRVELHLPAAHAVHTHTRYALRHDGREEVFEVDQSTAGEWALLAEVDFAAGGEQSVSVYDNESVAVPADQHIAVDAIRLVPVVAAPPEPPDSPDPPPADPAEPPADPEPGEPPAPSDTPPRDGGGSDEPLTSEPTDDPEGAEGPPPTAGSASLSGCSATGTPGTGPLPWLLLALAASRRRG